MLIVYPQSIQQLPDKVAFDDCIRGINKNNVRPKYIIVAIKEIRNANLSTENLTCYLVQLQNATTNHEVRIVQDADFAEETFDGY